MGRILAHWRTITAIFFSFVLIVGAYQLTRSIKFPSAVQASTEAALLQAIAAKDSDGDGLFDWEEALYGADPHIADTFNLGMTDGEAVAQGLVVPKAIANTPLATSSALIFDQNGLPQPAAEGTLTAAFAENFFLIYLAAKQANGGANLSENEIAAVANEALESLSSVIFAAPDFKSQRDLAIFGTGPDALKAFAVDAERVLQMNMSDAPKSEFEYLQDALEKDDLTAISQLASLAKTYRDSATGLAALRVPYELAGVDLTLINAMMRLSEIISDFARVNDDPLAAILALKQYQATAQALTEAFVRIGGQYKNAGILLPAGTPGASFVNLIDDMRREQAATTP